MYTDIIFLGSLLYLTLRGFSRGFWQSFAGPFGLIAATILSVISYSLNKNILLALAIGLLGPFACTFALRLLLNINGLLAKDNKPSLVSRLSGAGITLFSGLIFIIPIVIALSLATPFLKTVSPIGLDLEQSKVCSFTLSNIRRWAGEPKAKQSSAPQQTTGSVTSQKSIFEHFANDPRVQELLKDPDIQAAAEKKDYVALMTNQKILAISQNPEFIKVLMQIYTSDK